MALFRSNKSQLERLKLDDFKLEKDLQALVEANVDEIFNSSLEFITTEFELNGLRIDTLAFDVESNSFVIIEYKRGKSFSVVDQGFAYLSLMLNNKADFILEFNEHSGKNLKKGDVDWSQSRVIFVANSFTTHQQNAINFKDLPIELWEVKRYEGGMINFNQLHAADSSESIETVSKSSAVKEVASEVKKYSVDDHFGSDWEESRRLFDLLRERVLEECPILYEDVTKTRISYKYSGWNVIHIKVQKSGLLVRLQRHQPNDLDDPKSMVKYWKDSFKRYNQHISQVELKSDHELDYIMRLVRQVYEDFIEEKGLD